jgi:peptide/histidine transporter 3/4
MQVAFFYASLYLIAIARGIDKPCGVTFAADQFDPEHPREFASRSSLFNWWYFAIAIGMGVAVAIISYIQENLGWVVGFGILCAIVLCSFLVFVLGSSTYRLYAPNKESEGPFTRLASGLVLLTQGFKENGLNRLKEDEDALAKSEEARTVLGQLLIWASCLAYGVVYAQSTTLFNKQGRTLDRRIFGCLELPPAALQTFTPASILVFVPLYDRVLVPALRCSTGNPSGLTPLQRIGTGMAVSLAAVCVAALVEVRRLQTALEHGLVDDAGATVPMSWAWLVPQYAMAGLADVFAMVGIQEFFYDQMPSEMRSLGLALYYSVSGMGGFISGSRRPH